MRLVPASQHHPKSEFYGIIHPDFRKREGYVDKAKPVYQNKRAWLKALANCPLNLLF